MLLHNDKELFHEVIVSTANDLGIVVTIVEKDYYVTMILKELSKENIECVFKGGTSLSKCYHVIDRFSEDIDIAFSNKLTQSMRKRLKNNVIKDISNRLLMPITDWGNARSRRNYNCYTFSYNPIEEYGLHEGLAIDGVKMEVVLGSIAFPTEKLLVDSYVYRFLKKSNIEIIETYDLHPFFMNVQRMDRTLIDKVFALCDYYMEGKTQRYSRHIYDIYMLLPHVVQGDDLKKLIREVRSVRSEMDICPSAKKGVDINQLLNEIIETNIFKADYMEITTYFQRKPVPYETAIESLKEIIESGLFK